VAAGVVIAGAGLAAGLVLWPGAAQASLQDCKPEQFRCYADYFEQRTTKDGVPAAVKELKTAYAADGYVKAQCHQLTHAIGHAAYQKYSTLPAAYEHGDNFCWSGYYHGVTEEAIGKLGAAKIKADANSLCAELAKAKPYSFDHYNCVHGMGHGFFTVDNANLFEALNSCNLLKDNWEKDSCYGGVFMENVMIVARGDGTSKYLKPDQPLYPCTAVDKPYKQQCYLMQTSYILQQNNYDFKKTFDLCQNGPDTDFAATCFESTGRDASGSTVSDVAQTKTHCGVAPTDVALEHCMLGAVRDFVSYYHSDQQAKQLCQTFGSALEPRCLQEVTSYYQTFK
jgi:hypothetical protein